MNSFSVANIDLDLGHTALQFDKLHVEGGLLTPECSDLLLQAGILVLLVGVMSLHFLFDFKVLVCKSFANFLRLERNH